MNKLIETFPQQLQEALNLTKQIKAHDFSSDQIRHIAISGMGGSGIGVHLVRSILADYCAVPITLIQGYDLPKWVDEDTLFIACSYSGNTEETLTLFNFARTKTKHLFSITTGGKLKMLSEKNDIPQYNFSGEANCPRAGLAFPSVSILAFIGKLGFCSEFNIEQEIQATVTLLVAYQEEMQQKAKVLAERAHGFFTFLYADQRFYPAVLRFQQQLAENSKQLSHANVFPELNHNELVGWDFPENHLRNAKAIVLRSNYDHVRNQQRMDISKSIIEKKAEVLEIKPKGKSFTQQLYYFIHLIDWLSFYMAEQNQIDPFPVKNIDFLKNKLAE